VLKHFGFKAPGSDFGNHLDSHSATFLVSYQHLLSLSLSLVSVGDYVIDVGPNPETLVAVLRSPKAPRTHIATRRLHLSSVGKRIILEPTARGFHNIVPYTRRVDWSTPVSDLLPTNNPTKTTSSLTQADRQLYFVH
jgi:hypothetical protein